MPRLFWRRVIKMQAARVIRAAPPANVPTATPTLAPVVRPEEGDDEDASEEAWASVALVGDTEADCPVVVVAAAVELAAAGASVVNTVTVD